MQKRNIVKLFFCLVQLANLVAVAAAAEADFFVNRDNPPPGYIKVGDLKPTFYWVTQEPQSSAPKNQALLDMSGRVLAYVTAQFSSTLEMEGTGRLLDGRVLNFTAFASPSKNRQQARYRICGPDAPYGYGADGRILHAFHSVAVDPRLIPMDSSVYIPAAVGARLPDGTLHDGFFSADDVGGAIQDYRIDVFTAYGDQSALFENNGLINMKLTAVYVKKPTGK